jgi:O-antigen ligase
MLENSNDLNNIQHTREKIKLSTYILAAYVFLSLFNNSPFGAGLGKVIVPVMLYILIRFIFEVKTKIKLKPIHLLVILFWLSSLISTGFSQYVKINTDMVSSLAFTIFFIFATSKDYNRCEIRLLIKTLLCTGILASVFIIYNFLIGNQTGWAPRYSLEILGVMKDENYVSAFLMPILAYTYYMLFFAYKTEKKKKFALFFYSILISTGCLLTGSRAAFVSVISILIVLFYMILFKGKFSTIRKIALSILGAVLTIVIIVFADKILPEMISARLFDYGGYSTDIRFTDLWKTAISLFYENPILGSGLNAISKVYGIYSHSIYIDLLVGQGIIGLLIFVAILINLTKSRKQVRGLFFIMLFAFAMPLMTINGLNTTSIWTPILLIQILKSYLCDQKVTINDLI